MNPDRTKGGNFKGVIAYITHDQDKGESKDRVSFTHCRNLRTDDPEKAAKRMAWTASHAEDLKRQSGEKITGRKMEKPVYHLSLNWHPSEKPTQEEMIEAGISVLEALNMGEHQAVFAAHTDKEHQHLHIVVNRVHPEKGISPSLSHDQNILQKWAYEYEKAHGKIWCKERVAKYDDDPQVRKQAAERLRQEKQQAKDGEQSRTERKQGEDSARKQPQSKMRQAWEAQTKARVNPYAEDAADIRKRFAEQAKALSEQSKDMYAKQRREKTDLYEAYKQDKSKLWKERGKSLSGVYEHAKADNQGEWDALKNRQRGEYARLMNSIRKADFERQRNKKPLGLFMSVIEVWYNNTLVSDLQKQHQRQRDSLAEHQKKRREGKLNERKAYHDAKAAYAYSLYSEKKKQLEQKHDFDRKKTQERWKTLNEDRAKAWADMKAKQDHDRQKREEEAERRKRQQPKKPTRPPSFSERFNVTAEDARKERQGNQQGMTDDAMQRDSSGYGRGRGRRLE